MKPEKNILVLCAHNSVRSQMAEAFLRKHGGGRFAVHSAGLEPTDIHPSTRKVMAEVGLDLEGQRAKPVRDFLGKLTAEPEAQLTAFREVRDGIEHRVVDWLRDPDGIQEGARR